MRLNSKGLSQRERKPTYRQLLVKLPRDYDKENKCAVRTPHRDAQNATASLAIGAAPRRCLAPEPLRNVYNLNIAIDAGGIAELIEPFDARFF